MTILTSQKRTCYDRITTTNNNEEILIGLSGWMRRMLLEATITIAMIRGRKGTATGTITTTNHQHYQKNLVGTVGLVMLVALFYINYNFPNDEFNELSQRINQ